MADLILNATRPRQNFNCCAPGRWAGARGRESEGAEICKTIKSLEQEAAHPHRKPQFGHTCHVWVLREITRILYGCFLCRRAHRLEPGALTLRRLRDRSTCIKSRSTLLEYSTLLYSTLQETGRGPAARAAGQAGAANITRRAREEGRPRGRRRLQTAVSGGRGVELRPASRLGASRCTQPVYKRCKVYTTYTSPRSLPKD
eukprot:scaffold15918_cov73-Phaeocystis_antarctica.AAC.3